MINEEATFRWKGYRSTNLSRGSGKRVWANCDECGHGRWVAFYQYRDLCVVCANKTEDHRRILSESAKRKIVSDTTRKKMSISRMGEKNNMYGKKHTQKAIQIMRESKKGRCIGKNNPNWRGGLRQKHYCLFFDEPLKDTIRGYFSNICFECGTNVDENMNRELSVHHVNYQKDCGCDNTQFCIYVPLCMKCHGKSGHNRWYWYIKFMTELALRNPNYYAYHIPVVFYDEPSYNYEYVFEKRRR